MSDSFDMIYDAFRLFAECQKDAEILTEQLKEQIDNFTALLIEKYENDGSFNNGWRDGLDITAPAMTAAVNALAHTICCWQNPETRTRELKMAVEWLNELVAREPIPKEAESILESYRHQRWIKPQ